MSDRATIAERHSVFDAPKPVGTSSAADNFAIRIADPTVRFSLRMDAGPAVRGAAGFDLSQSINQMRQSVGGHQSIRLGPDEWLLIAAATTEPADALAARLATDLGDHPHTLVDVSHRNVAFELSGALSADVLNTGCPLDLGNEAFPAGTATRTLFAKAEIILCRCSDQDQRPLYRVECWRSFGRYLLAYLQESAELIGAGS